MAHLIGDGIVLREYREDDFSAIRRWVNDPEIAPFLSSLYPGAHTEEMTRTFLKGVLEHRDDSVYPFVIARGRKEEYLGQIDLRIRDRIAGRADFGIVIPDPRNRRRGYGRAAIRLLADFAFNRLNIHRLELQVHASNEGAIALYEAMGFRSEGQLRDYYFRDGTYHDILVMAMIRP